MTDASRRLSTPARVGILVLAFHALWIAAFFVAGHEARDFIRIGYRFVQQSHASQVIKFDPNYHYPPNPGASNGNGYDGQFGYYMALDPVNARYYMDEPAYRYSRVLYPALAGVLALGQSALLPYTLLLVNWLAVGLGSLALAAWLRRRGSPPAWALVYGLYPGLLIGLQRDLTEPLAYGLLAAGIYLLDARRTPWPAAIAFGLAGLARQTTIVFPLVYAVAILVGGDGPYAGRFRRNLPGAAGLSAIAVAPIIAWTLFLRLWLGSFGKGAGFDPVPFVGLVSYLLKPWHITQHGPLVVAIIIPTLLWIAATVLVARRRGIRVELVLLWLNAVLFLFWSGSVDYYQTYTSIGRVIIGVVLAAVLCVPLLERGRSDVRRLAVGGVVLWMAILPLVLAYPFTSFKVAT